MVRLTRPTRQIFPELTDPTVFFYICLLWKIHDRYLTFWPCVVVFFQTFISKIPRKCSTLWLPKWGNIVIDMFVCLLVFDENGLCSCVHPSCKYSRPFMRKTFGHHLIKKNPTDRPKSFWYRYSNHRLFFFSP